MATPGSASRWHDVETSARYLLRRLGTAVVALLGVTLIVFLLSRNVGDPVYLLVGQQGTPEQIAQLRDEYGFNRPWHVQYFDYLAGLLQGDLGESLFSGKPVTEEIATYFPATLELAISALFAGVLITVPLGIVAALRPRSWIDRFASGFVRFGIAMPAFWLGILLIYIFVYSLEIAPPPTGELDIGVLSPPDVTGMTVVDAALAGQWDVFRNALAHLVLPTLTLAIAAFPALLALTRNVTERVLRSDFMRTAKATGLPPRVAYGRYALRNVAPPIVTQCAMTFGFLLGGTVLVETVFAWPGIGQYSVLSMQRLDFAPVLGVALVTSAAYLTLYFLADVMALAIDPRIRHQR